MKYSRNRVSKIKDKKRSSRKIQLLKRFKAKGGIKSTNKKKKCGNLKYKTLKYIGGDKETNTKTIGVKTLDVKLPITKDDSPKPIASASPATKPTDPTATKPTDPTATATKPTVPATKPTVPATKPTVPATKPTVPAAGDGPTVPTKPVTTATTKPVTVVAPKSVIADAQPKPSTATKPSIVAVTKPTTKPTTVAVLSGKPSDKDIAAKNAAIKAISQKTQSDEKKELTMLKEMQTKQETQIQELKKQLAETQKTSTKPTTKPLPEKQQKDVELHITEKQTSMAKKTVDVSIVVPNDSNVVVKNYAQNTTNEVMKNQ